MDWPWTPEISAPGHTTSRFIHAFGVEPWHAGQALNVTVGAPPGSLSEPDLSCSSTLGGGNTPCSDAFEVVTVDLPDGGRQITIQPALGIRYGFALFIELEREGDPYARVCLMRVTDAIWGLCEPDAARPAHWSEDCATSGTVQFGEGGGYLDVQFGEGYTLEGWW